MDAHTIVVFGGDQTGQELLEAALRVLAGGRVGVELSFPEFDLSLANRRATNNAVVHDAARAVAEHGLGLKAATITPEGADDVGSPNRILREDIGGKVIVRTGRRIPGVVPVGGVHAPISVVRMAVGDAYGATEWREGYGDEEVAFRTERIERRICRAVAEFSFRQAERTGAKVFGGPKYTVSPVYEGMLKEEMDAAAGRPSRRAVRATADRCDVRAPDLLERRPDGHSRPQPRRRHPLRPRAAAVRLDRRVGVAPRRVRRRGNRPAHRGHGGGRARHRPLARGQGRREPDGHDPRRCRAARARRRTSGARRRAARSARRRLEAVAEGIRTADLGGHHGTTEFTDEVIRRTRTKLDVWASL